MIASVSAASAALAEPFAMLRRAAAANEIPPAVERRAHLRALERMVKQHAAVLSQAISDDFGHRSAHETQLLEIVPTLEAARHARRHVARWMKPTRAAVAPYLWPARARIERQPLGVVGIIVPWNYPVLLALGPLIAALAAGNRAFIKLSELTPRTGVALGEALAAYFSPDHVTLVHGGADLGRAFAALPFDHLLFTGSTATGRSVMHAAADNLTPVTLELGGKSPAIVGPDASIATAAARIMAAKCRNAGQSCIAPDYVLLPEGATDAFITAARDCVSNYYPVLTGNPDYTNIIGGPHVERLSRLIADATANGATIVPLHSSSHAVDVTQRGLPPAIVLNLSDGMLIMDEEIFGPFLPVRTYATLADAIAFVNARPRPLALYYFGDAAADVAAVVGQTRSGGVCLNDAMLQFAVEALPFGGIGPSGMGAYHGRAGFETFSHPRAILAQAKRPGSALLNPPYGPLANSLIRILTR